MRGWGILLIILGIGSYVLPMMGMQFMLVQIFGDSPVVGASFIVAGGVLLLLSFRKPQSE